MKITLASLLLLTSLTFAEDKAPAKPDTNTTKPQPNTAKPDPKPVAKTPSAKPAAPGLTDEQAQAALQFAAEHHPELAKLLETLKTTRKAEFQRALRELHVARTRLEGLKTRLPERYALELEIWKTGSRARLIAAQTAMDPAGEKALQEELRKTLSAQYDAKQKLLEFEKKELAARLSKMDADLKHIQAARQDDIERDLQQLLRSAQQKQKALENQRVAKKTKKKDTPTSAADSDKKEADKKTDTQKKTDGDKKSDTEKKTDSGKK